MGLILEGIQKAFSLLFTLDPEVLGITWLSLAVSGAATLITEAVGISESIVDKDRALADCIAKMKSDNLKERRAMIQDAIGAAHNQKNDNRVNELVAEFSRLENEIRKLDKV